jgi:hypothetical protein
MQEFSNGSAPVNRADLHAAHTWADTNNVISGGGLVYVNSAQFTRIDAPARYFLTPSADFEFTGALPFTVAAWFYLISQTVVFPFYSYIISALAGPGAGTGWNFFVSGTDLCLYCGGGGGTANATHAVGATTGAWHLGIGWFDPTGGTLGTGGIYSCVYSNAINSVDYALGAGNYPNANIVCGCDAKTIGNKPWDGYIGPAMVWGRVITAAQRTVLWNGGAGLPYASFTL